jgi:hypothetical protein
VVRAWLNAARVASSCDRAALRLDAHDRVRVST